MTYGEPSKVLIDNIGPTWKMTPGTDSRFMWRGLQAMTGNKSMPSVATKTSASLPDELVQYVGFEALKCGSSHSSTVPNP